MSESANKPPISPERQEELAVEWDILRIIHEDNPMALIHFAYGGPADYAPPINPENG